MDEHAFVSMVGRQERAAQSNPGLYKFGVLLFGLLGYAYILLLLLISVALLIGLGFAVLLGIQDHTYTVVRLLPLGLPLLLLALGILQSLMVTIPEPTGMELTRGDATPMFIEIDRIRSRMALPRFDKVIMTRDMNAGVVQVPRLGILGWQKNILIIGLPLVMSLPPDSFRAVLAHEMGHVSGAHGKFAAWVVRINLTWYQLLMNIQHNPRAALLVGSFLGWYVPRFNAYSMALRKSHEYDADEMAAQAVGAKLLADALIRLEFLSILQTAAAPGRPPTQAQIDQMTSFIFSYRSSPNDDHPSLIERLTKMRQLPFTPGSMTESSAQKYLGHRLPGIIQFLRIGLS